MIEREYCICAAMATGEVATQALVDARDRLDAIGHPKSGALSGVVAVMRSTVEELRTELQNVVEQRSP